MADRYPEPDLVLDDELLFEEGHEVREAPRRSSLSRREERVEDIVREGEVLAGKYRVERIPGRNGLGVLVQVRHMELGQEVTLKFLVPEACAYPEFVQRFVREARAAVRIQGEHVARVTDVGRLESGAPYMVREYLRGPDLAEVLKVRGPLPISEAVDYVVQACEGVAEGHALGVVHRNLRPTSLIVVRRSDGTPLLKVFDFAAAESLHVNPFTERAVSLVGTSAIMGSLPYLAPEQIRDPHDVDFRADVYSLGAVLFELLTGTPVYAADAAPALLAKVAADPAPSMRELRPEIPGELDHVVLRCLAKNRAIRYPSVAELVAALQPFASEEVAGSLAHIARLSKRTSKVTEPSERRAASVMPAASASVVPPLVQATAAGRDRHDTFPLRGLEPLKAQSERLSRGASYEDVTTINPYLAYAAPVVQPESVPVRLTPRPPPLRASVPPPLQPTISAVPAISDSSVNAPPLQTTELPPPPRSSVPAMSRSWAAPYPEAVPFLSPRRLVAVGVVAACASLGAVLAFRVGAPRAVAAAQSLGVEAAPTQTPRPVATPVTAVALTAAPGTALAPPAVAPAPASALPAAVAAPASAAAAPVAPPVAVAVPVAPLPVARALAVARRPAAPHPRDEAPAEKPTKAEAVTEQKVASTRPTAGDLFDDPR